VSYIPWYLTVIRLIVPISILRFPLLGMLASIEADILDWNFIGVTSGQVNVVYQNWDKAMDFYSYLFVVWIVLHWSDIWARRIALGLFGYRAIGTVLFWITGRPALLFFFPNVFENFVILCLIIFWLSKKKKLNFEPRQKVIMLAVLIIPKMIQEYFQHFLGRQPWELYSLGSWLGLRGTALVVADPLLWGGLLYLVPTLGFLLYIRRKIFYFPNRNKPLLMK